MDSEAGILSKNYVVNSISDSSLEENESLIDGTPHVNYEYLQDQKPKYDIFFVVMPVFCGYACLFALQAQVKSEYGIANNASPLSHEFSVAASLVYIGNFVFRLGHNVFFAPFQPRTRVIISMISMSFSMALICIVFYFLKNANLGWVFAAYAFGGMSIGTFESNLLSTITPIGKRTKFWAILAIPTGILSVTVGGFALLQAGLHASYIYLFVAVYNLFGALLFILRFYRHPSANMNAISLRDFIQQLLEFREWLPQIAWHSIALLGDMFCVAMFSPGVILYIYSAPYISFPWFHSKLSKDWLFCAYDAGFFLGDFLSRRIFYPVRIVFPLVFWIFASIGVAAALCSFSFFVPFAGFFVAFCNGSIYSQANRRIDTTVDKKYNLIAFSFWLFIGDIGSVIGSNSIPYVKDRVTSMYHMN